VRVHAHTHKYCPKCELPLAAKSNTEQLMTHTTKILKEKLMFIYKFFCHHWLITATEQQYIHLLNPFLKGK